MSDDSVQTHGTHIRWLPPWHFFAFPVLMINAITQIVFFAKSASLDTAWNAVVWIAVAVAVFLSRYMPLKTQDRIIRLEERLRLLRLMPNRVTNIERLTADHLIGIRFASDAELSHLLDRIVAGELVTRQDIKRSVQHWRADHLRV